MASASQLWYDAASYPATLPGLPERATPSQSEMTAALSSSGPRDLCTLAAKANRIRRQLVGAVAGLAILSGCGGGSDDPPPQLKPPIVATVRVTPSTAAVDVGATLQLAVATVDAQGAALTGRTVSWTSLQPALATVSASGLVTGLTAGTVTISATSDGITGTAAIVVLPTLAARCDATTDIALGQTVNGALLGTDCRLSDDSYADKYVLTLTESTPVRFLMTSAVIDAYLIVQDATSGQIVAENDDGNGSTDSRIEQVLPAGRYVVAANSFEANDFGDYQLSVTRASAACLASTPITTPGTVTGTLAATACVLSDTSYTDRYALSVRSATLLTATMRSDVFDSFLFIESASGVSVGRNDNSGGGLDARLSVSLDPGEYIINANSTKAREVGAYSLILSSRIDPCGTSRALTVGQTLADTLTTAGCKLTDGSYVKRYSLAITAPTAIRIDATSTQFDPYLLVQQTGSAGALAEDDDAGVGLNAQILQVLPVGTYVVTVTSATAGEVGLFDLSVSGAEQATVGVAVTPATVTLTPGLTQQLTATITGSTNGNVAWKSSAPNFVSITPTGQVRAITAGAATITATSAADPSRTATAEVTVTAGTDANLDLPLVYLTQSIQAPDGRIPLIAGRQTIARVFVRGSRSGLGTAAVRLRFFNGATVLGTLTGTATIATAIDEACCSADILVPEALIREGATLIADVDPANAIAESNEGDNAWPLTGASKPIRVITVPPINIQLVPIRHRTTGLVGPSSTDITAQLIRMYPLGQVNVAIHAEYATDTPALTDGTSWIAMLREIEGLRALENRKEFFFGVLNQVAATGIVGIANIRGFVGLGIGGPDAAANETLTHEFGHSFGRQHSPSPGCGAPANVDTRFPRADGTIGFYGYDVPLRTIFQPGRFDIMGYCNNTWTSEYTYLGILEYLNTAVIPISTGTTTMLPVLLINGSMIGGTVDMDPVFAHLSTPTAQKASGQFVAEGRARDGRVLFRHRFDGASVGDADPTARTFMAQVPYDPAVSGAVVSITVRDEQSGSQPAMRVRSGTYSGVPGGISLRVDADPELTIRASGGTRFDVSWNVSRYPSIVVRNRRTGRVLGIGRRGAMTIEASSLTDVEAMLSDGVGSTSRQLTIGGAP